MQETAPNNNVGMPQSRPGPFEDWFLWVKWGAIAVVVFWLLWGYLVWCGAGNEWNWGLFGDSFGAPNALFSGLAFVILIGALLMQKKELELQREELEATRAELTGQKMELEKQATALTEQVNSGTFFQMLSLLAQSADAATFVDNKAHGSPRLTGEEALQRLVDRIRHAFSNLGTEHNEYTVRAVYEGNAKEVRGTLGQYFALLESVLVCLRQMCMDKNSLYAQILATQISDFQLTILAYAYIAEDLSPALMESIREYALLRKLRDNKGLVVQTHRGLVNHDAWNV